MNGRLSLLVVAALLVGCAGDVAQSGQVPTRPASENLQATIVVPARTRHEAHAARGMPAGGKPQYVSPNSEGLKIVSYPHGSAKENGSAIVDISPGSPLCSSGSGGTRVCNVAAPAVPGTDDIDFTDYDEAPVGGSIPPGAHVLSVASLIAFDVVANQANTATVYLEGQPYQFALTPGVMSFPASGKSQVQTLGVEVQDADGNDIVTSPDAPFDAAVTLQVGEDNGGGHVKLEENGADPATAQTFTTSTNSFQLLYDGGGSSGSGSDAAAYWASVTASASTDLEYATMQIAPLYLSGKAGSGARFTAGYPASIAFTSPGQGVALALVQFVEPTGGTGYAVANTTCEGSGSVAGVNQAGANSPDFVVTAGASAGTCAITLTDGVSTYPVNVTEN